MNVEQILIFEPERVDNFYPFSVMHPAWELRCGAFRMFERVQRQFPNAVTFYHGREKHTKLFIERFNIPGQKFEKKNTLVILGISLISNQSIHSINEKYSHFINENNASNSVVFVSNKIAFAAFIPKKELINTSENDFGFLTRLLSDFNSAINVIEIDNIRFVDFLWDAIEYNAEFIKNDDGLLPDFTNLNADDYPAANFISPERIKTGTNVSIAPGVVIDATEGPVLFGNNVKIMANAFIEGPCFIGDNSVVKVGAKIYGKTSIGEVCKAGGEIENSIIQSYSNKQHEGFLGHSFISEWVNIGADTNTSDLKNTYGEIKVRLRELELNSGRMFLGLLCGDHTKTAINTQFNTGTVCGVCGIIVTNGFPPTYIPSFSWGGRKDSMKYKVSKAIEVAEKVMARRGKLITEAEKELLLEEFEQV